MRHGGWQRFPPEDVPVAVEGSGQGPWLRHGVQVGLQVLSCQPSAFPPDSSVAAGEQRLQSLQERTHETPKLFTSLFYKVLDLFNFGKMLFSKKNRNKGYCSFDESMQNYQRHKTGEACIFF